MGMRDTRLSENTFSRASEVACGSVVLGQEKQQHAGTPNQQQDDCHHPGMPQIDGMGGIHGIGSKPDENHHGRPLALGRRNVHHVHRAAVHGSIRSFGQWGKFPKDLENRLTVHRNDSSPCQYTGRIYRFKIQIGAITASHPIHPAIGNNRTVDASHQQVGNVRLGRGFNQQPLKLEPAAVPPAHAHARAGFKGSDQGGALFHHQADALLLLAVDGLQRHQGHNGQHDQDRAYYDPWRKAREEHSEFMLVRHHPAH